MYKIHLRYEGIEISIEMTHRISALSDDSGVGKTYVAKAISSALKVKKYNSIVSKMGSDDCDIHVIFEDTKQDEVKKIVKEKNSIIIIDETDKIIGTNPNIVKKILKNEESAYLLILRGDPEGLILGTNQYLRLKSDEKCIKIFPFKSKMNDFFKEG